MELIIETLEKHGFKIAKDETADFFAFDIYLEKYSDQYKFEAYIFKRYFNYIVDIRLKHNQKYKVITYRKSSEATMTKLLVKTLTDRMQRLTEAVQ